MRSQGATQLSCGATHNSLRGQGATEYLVLLAVVIIIALVTIALLGFYPSLSTDAQITQSQAYWSGEASPFRITELTYAVAGTSGICSGLSPTKIFELIIENKGTGTYTINTINISFDGTTYYGTPGNATAGRLCDAAVTVYYGLNGAGDYDGHSRGGPFTLAPGEKVHAYIDSSEAGAKCQATVAPGGNLSSSGYYTKTVAADINISYETEYRTNITQYGAKKYYFKCSKAL